MIREFYYWILLAFTSISLIIQDIKYKEVNLLLCIIFFALCIILRSGFTIFPITCFILIALIYYIKYKKQAFGIADYILIFGSSFLINNIETAAYFILLCGLFGTILGFFYKQTIPLIPAIILAIACCLLIQIYAKI